MSTEIEVYAVGLSSGKDRLNLRILNSGEIELEVCDSSSGRNTRTARIKLRNEQHHALAKVLEQAGPDREAIGRAMMDCFGAVGGSLGHRPKGEGHG